MPHSSSQNWTVIFQGDNDTATYVVRGLVVGLAIISLVLRFYTRAFTKAGLWWDDWMILVAVLATVLTVIPLIWANAVNPHGDAFSENPDPRYDYRPNNVLYLKLSFVSSILYFTIAGSAKLSILCMYNRLFSVDTAFRRQLVVSSIVVLGWWIGCTVATLASCIPLKWSWINGIVNPGHCFDYNIFWMASGVCEMFIDVLILTLPIRAVHRLQLSKKRKATVSFIFLLGGFVIITGLVKVILGYAADSRVPSYSRTEVWTTVHVGMAIVCACLPIFKPLVNRASKSALFTKLRTLVLYIGSYGSRGWGVANASGRRRNERSGSSMECGLMPVRDVRSLQQKQKPDCTGDVEEWPLRDSMLQKLASVDDMMNTAMIDECSPLRWRSNG